MSASTVTLLVIAVQLMMPLAWAALGEIVSERAGVLNVGVEGAVLIGAWAAAVAHSNTGSFVLGLAGALGAGAVFGLVLAALYVWRGVDQVVGGVMVNLFAVGFTSAMWVRFEGDQPGQNIPALAIPVLEDIPVLGRVLFQQNVLVYAVVVMGVILVVGLGRTSLGLALRAAGEAPEAVDGAGMNVNLLRSCALTFGTILAAFGGAALVLTASSGRFVNEMSSGLGYIALGLVLLARWRPLVAILLATAFGLLQALQYQAQSTSWLQEVPSDVVLMLPYVAAVVVVALSKGSRYPAALGTPWVGGSSH